MIFRLLVIIIFFFTYVLNDRSVSLGQPIDVDDLGRGISAEHCGGSDTRSAHRCFVVRRYRCSLERLDTHHQSVVREHRVDNRSATLNAHQEPEVLPLFIKKPKKKPKRSQKRAKMSLCFLHCVPPSQTLRRFVTAYNFLILSTYELPLPGRSVGRATQGYYI